jgi:N-acetylmuramoyl-L-alanine amidase
VELTLQQAYQLALLALCIWREARGEPIEAKRGVAWVVRNRATNPSWWGGPSFSSVILKLWQFSSFNHTDPNATKWPADSDPSWVDSLSAAAQAFAGLDEDPTLGATHYFDKSLDANPPAWATDGSMTKTVDLGALHFFKRAVPITRV